MSLNRKNNHYHYAEQFTDRARRRARRPLLLPRKAVFFAVLVLLAFGVICTTFSANIGYVDSEGGSIIVRVRNPKADQDYSVDGVNRNVYSDGDGLAVTGASVDRATVGTDVGGTDYYIIGDGSAANNGNWGGWTALTKHSSGYYSYFYCANNTSFKVSTDQSYNNAFYTWAYDFYGNANTYTSNNRASYFNQGNGTNANGTHDMWIKGGNYIVVWYPYTDLRRVGTPLITCFSSLPSSPSYQVHYGIGNDQWTQTTLTTTANPVTETSSWSCTISLEGDAAYEFEIQKIFTDYPNKGTIYYKRGSTNNMYYNSGAWTFGTTNTDTNHAWLHTVTTGDYTFTLDSTKWYDEKVTLSIAFPQYSFMTAINDAEACTFTPTVANVSVGNSVSVPAAPSPNTGFTFEKWELTAGSAKTGSYASGSDFTGTTSPSALTLYPYGKNTTVTLTAKYKRDVYTITYAPDDEDDPAATAGAITGSVSPGSKEYGRSYTIPNAQYTRAGYTQVAWATTANYTSTSPTVGVSVYPCDGTGTYSGNDHLTLYPVWRINSITAASNTSLSPQVNTSGTIKTSQTFSLGLDVSAAPTYDATRTFTYTPTNTFPSGASVTLGTNPADATNFMKFGADTPGVYKFTVTVTDSCSTGVTNSPVSATTAEITVTVEPDAPDFNVVLYRYMGGGGDGSSGNGYQIMTGDKYYFKAQVANSSLVNGYTYTFSRNSDFSVAADIVGSFTYSTGGATGIYFDAEYNVFSDPTGSPDPRSTASVSTNGEIGIVLYCRISHNNQYSETGTDSLYYYIQKLVKEFDYIPYQKIYNEYYSKVDLAADYNFGDPSGYTTYLKFSDDNNTYYDAITAISNQFLSSFKSIIESCMYFTGPKYFYMVLTGTVNGETVTSESDKIHTTVGTAHGTATRPLFFYNNVAACGLKDYRVMCYYIKGDNTLGYQVAQDMYRTDENKAGRYYRVNIPADATYVKFGFVDKESGNPYYYYGKASLSGSTISCTATPVFKGYTAQVALNDTIRVIQSSTKTDLNGQWSFNAVSGPYTPVPVS